MIMPILSIIIPVYNSESYLRACLDSVVSQSIKDWELILVEDGSTDGSGVICDEYSSRDERIHVFHKNNGGVSSARNLGLDKATGEWIAFVDADDWIEPNYVETLSSLDNDADIVFFPMSFRYVSREMMTKVPKAKYALGREEVESVICDLKYGVVGDLFGWAVVKFFKRSIIEEYHIRFDENIQLREDEMFTMDYCRYINSITVLDKVLYNYRVFGDGNLLNKHRIIENINLANHIDSNLKYFHNAELINKERQRVAWYYIEKFRGEESFFNMYNAMKKIHSFFNENPEYKQFAYDKHLVEVLSHSRFVSFLLLEIRYVLMGIYSRIK